MEIKEGFENFKHSIELDCAPGSARPDTLLPGVIEDTGLVLEDFHNTSRSFGNWTFELNPEKNYIYEKYKEIIASRITNLYPSRIRYGSW
jgi:hypothetical protein